MAEVQNQTSRRVADLRQILADRSFSLAYQPIVDLSDRAVHHYEALARFEGDRSTFGTVVFAEETGMALDFDLAISRAVIDMLMARGCSRPVDIAINLSGHSLQSSDFTRSFERLLASIPAGLGNILIEVTETAEIEDLARVNKVLQKIRAAGHPVCIDDFGTGSSVFHYLKAFDVDFVKIDRSLIKAVETEGVERSILNAILHLCSQRDASVIAEGVESEAQAVRLLEVGIPYGQGYALGVPNPVIP